MATVKLIATVALAVGLKELTDDLVDVQIDDPDMTPDFKEVRTDPAHGRNRTHPTSFRKGQR